MKIVVELNDDEVKNFNKFSQIYRFENAIFELQKLRKALYKGYCNNTITVQNKEKIISDIELLERQKDFCHGKAEYPYFENTESYISIKEVLDEIDNILDERLLMLIEE